jgi:hypothetical protein
MKGNTDGSLYMYCHARLNLGPGFASQGNDTQIMTYQDCDANNNLGCGFRDSSFIGNLYTGCHTDANTYKVLNNFAYYVCIFNHISAAINEPGVGANWEDFWVSVPSSIEGASTSWEAYWASASPTIEPSTWAPAENYRDTGGVNTGFSASSHACLINHYSEGGIEAGVIPRALTSIFGGFAGSGGRIHKRQGIAFTSIVGTQENTPSDWIGLNIDKVQNLGKYYNCILKHVAAAINEPGVGANFTDFWVEVVSTFPVAPVTGGQWITATTYFGDTYGSALGTVITNPDFFDCGHSADPDVSLAGKGGLKLTFVVNNGGSYRWTKNVQTPVLDFPTEDWTKSGYTGLQPYFQQGLIVGGETDNPNIQADVRIRGTVSLAALDALAIDVVEGEVFFKTSVSPGGTAMVVVTTSGVTGSTAVLKEACDIQA